MKNQSNNQAEVLLDPRKYVQFYFQRNALEVLPNGTVANYKLDSDLLCSLFLDYSEEFKAYAETRERKPVALTERKLELALSEFIRRETEAIRQATLDSIKFNGNHDTTLLTKWVKAVTGTEDTLDIAVMGHFLGQVKRKALGLRVYEPNMPVIYCRVQRGGKTTAVEALFEPLKRLTAKLALNEISDSRTAMALENNYIGFLDEMANCERALIANLKRILSAGDIDTRVLGTNKMKNIKINVTMIGTSNKPVNELIFDESMGRYYQLNALPQLDWAAINEIDYLALWQSIDHNHDFITPVRKELRAAQVGLSTIDQVDEYFIEAGILSEGPKVECTLDVLYSDYVIFCGNSGSKALTKQFFSKKLRSRGLEAVDKKIDGKTKTCYMIPAGSVIEGRVYLGVAK